MIHNHRDLTVYNADVCFTKHPVPSQRIPVDDHWDDPLGD